MWKFNLGKNITRHYLSKGFYNVISFNYHSNLSKWTTKKNDWISSYYFYAMNEASERFELLRFLGGQHVVVEQQRIFLVALICTTNI